MGKFAAIALLLVLVQVTLAAPKWPHPWPAPERECKPKIDVGQKCKAATTVWGYDSSTNKCKQFKYGGCKGNDNRFNSEFNCRITCVAEAPGAIPAGPPPGVIISPHGPNEALFGK